MASMNPGRPATEKDLTARLNGCPMFPAFPMLQPGQLIPGSTVLMSYAALGQAPASGVLTSTGTAVNNVTTATPFGTGALQADNVTRDLLGSLAGRVLLVSATAAGFLMASDSPLVGNNAYWTVATQATIPPAINTFPGVPCAALEVKLLIMLPTTGWLQWISTTGTASLIVEEMF